MVAVRDEILDGPEPGAPGSPTTTPARRKSGPPLGVYMPLIYAPLLPMIRIGLRGRVAPATRDRLFFGAVLVALGHAGYVMSGDSSMGAGT